MIRIVAKLDVTEGKLDEFIEVAKNITKTLNIKEPGTTGFEWYLNGNECTVIETYKDSEAILQHMQNSAKGELRSPIPDLASLAEMHIFGPANDAVKNALAPRGVKFSSLFSNYNR